MKGLGYIPKPNGPCKDCPERFLGCHDRCGKYQTFKKNLAVIKRHNAALYWRRKISDKRRA